jgi:hypothetical protein
MVNNLYLVLVVVFRTAGIYLCVSAIFVGLTSKIMGLAEKMSFVFFLSFGLGILLWFAAKLVARLITNDLK